MFWSKNTKYFYKNAVICLNNNYYNTYKSYIDKTVIHKIY